MTKPSHSQHIYRIDGAESLLLVEQNGKDLYVLNGGYHLERRDDKAYLPRRDVVAIYLMPAPKTPYEGDYNAILAKAEEVIKALKQGEVVDENGNLRQDHTHTRLLYPWESPFSLAAPETEEEHCDDVDCFGVLEDGTRDIRNRIEISA